MTLRARAERESVMPGIWTPWAQVLCGDCHGPRPDGVFRPETHHFWDHVMDPVPVDPGRVLTTCDVCGRLIQISFEVGREHRAAAILTRRGIANAGMAQTGGMCSALEVATGGEMPDGTPYDGHVWLTLDQGETDADDQYDVGEYRCPRSDTYGDFFPGYEGEDCQTYPSLKGALRAVEAILWPDEPAQERRERRIGSQEVSRESTPGEGSRSDG